MKNMKKKKSVEGWGSKKKKGYQVYAFLIIFLCRMFTDWRKENKK